MTKDELFFEERSQLLCRGVKYDQDKPRWDLLEYQEIEELVKVLTMGAKKYSDQNWKLIDNIPDRYFAAAMRHLTSWRKGDKLDNESGLPHLAHAMACLMFMMWNDRR